MSTIFCTTVFIPEKPSKNPGHYLYGAIALAKSLLSKQPEAVLGLILDYKLYKHPLMSVIRMHFREIMVVNLAPEDVNLSNFTTRMKELYASWMTHSLTKFNFLRFLIKYERVIFVDADIVFVEFPTGLTTINCPAAWCGSMMSKEHDGKIREKYAISNDCVCYYPIGRKHGDAVPAACLERALESVLKEAEKPEGNSVDADGFVTKKKQKAIGFPKTFSPSGGIYVVDRQCSYAAFVDSVRELKEICGGQLHTRNINGSIDELCWLYYLHKLNVGTYHIGIEYLTMDWHRYINETEGNRKVIGYHFFGSEKPWFTLIEGMPRDMIARIKGYRDTPIWHAIFETPVVQTFEPIKDPRMLKPYDGTPGPKIVVTDGQTEVSFN